MEDYTPKRRGAFPAADACFVVHRVRAVWRKGLEPLVLGLTTLLLALTALLAGSLPARRAARVQPMTALRYE